MGVLQLVADDQEGRLPPVCRQCKNVFHLSIFLNGGHRHYSLVHRAAAELVKLPGIRLLDSGSRRLCLCNQGEQAAVLFSALHIEAVNGPACAQRF